MMRDISSRAEGVRISRTTLALLAAFAIVVGTLLVTSAGAQTPGSSDVVDTAGPQGFIKFDGLAGESHDANHPGWSELSSFDQALLVPAAGAVGGRAAPRAIFDMLVAKRLDTTGPGLQRAVATGKIFPVVEIELTLGAGAEAAADVFYRYKLSGVQVMSYNVGTTGQDEVTATGLPQIELGGRTIGDSWPVEELSLTFQKMEVSYIAYDEAGQPGPSIDFIWNLKKNMEE